RARQPPRRRQVRAARRALPQGEGRMKALSVKQPWITLIASGRKTIEVRSWSTRYRGPLVLVASRGPDWNASPALVAENAPRGVTLTLVDLVDVRLAREGDAPAALCMPLPGDYAWVLACPRAIAHLPVRGRLGLYDVDDALVRPVEAR